MQNSGLLTLKKRYFARGARFGFLVIGIKIGNYLIKTICASEFFFGASNLCMVEEQEHQY